MNLYAFPPIAAVLDGVYHLLTFLGGVLDPLFPVAASAASIVLITLLVRAALIPVGVSQARAEAVRRRLAPRLAELRKCWGKNPERLQQETMALYKEENSSPFAGFLPMLVQLPVVGVVYALFIQPQINGHVNELLHHTVFGVPLGSSFVSVLGGAPADWMHGLVFAALLLVIATVATLSRRFLAPPAIEGAAGAGAVGAVAPDARPVPGAAGVARILSFAPYVTVVIAAFVPLAATLYLSVTTAWTLVERLVLRRRLTGSAG